MHPHPTSVVEPGGRRRLRQYGTDQGRKALVESLSASPSRAGEDTAMAVGAAFFSFTDGS